MHRKVHQSVHSTKTKERIQWIVMLLKNTTQTPDTLNAKAFHLTTSAPVLLPRNHTVTFDASRVQMNMEAVIERAEKGDGQHTKDSINRLEQQDVALDTSEDREIQVALRGLPWTMFWRF